MSLASEMVVLEHVLSKDAAKECALKVQQLPLDQQYSTHSTCVMLSVNGGGAASVESPDISGFGALFALVLVVVVILIVAAMGWATQETRGGWDD